MFKCEIITIINAPITCFCRRPLISSANGPSKAKRTSYYHSSLLCRRGALSAVVHGLEGIGIRSVRVKREINHKGRIGKGRFRLRQLNNDSVRRGAVLLTRR
jgi:hypothetical protein